MTTTTTRAWRKVVSRGKLSGAYRGTGHARLEKLECGHSVRVTGDNAIAMADKRICRQCENERE